MNKKQLGEFIRSTRTEQGLSQEKLAEKSGRKRLSILEIENDKVDFGIQIFLDLIGILGYDITLIPTPPTESFMFDFSKIECPPMESTKGLFKKRKTKNNEKSNRRTSK